MPLSVPPASAKPDPAVVKVLAPSGRLRAAINLGNSILAQEDANTGELKGVSAALAKQLAGELGVPLEMIRFTEAGAVADGAAKGEWDVAFLARDPKRAETIAFTAPYVVIEGVYMVRASSPFHASADVDRDGVRITAGVGAAYELFLTRALKHATLVRDPSSMGAIELFLKDNTLDAAAGVGAVLGAIAKGRGDLRLIRPGFQVIEQAMCLPRGHEAAIAFAQTFIELMKACGFVRTELDASGQGDTVVAPAAGS